MRDPGNEVGSESAQIKVISPKGGGQRVSQVVSKVRKTTRAFRHLQKCFFLFFLLREMTFWKFAHRVMNVNGEHVQTDGLKCRQTLAAQAAKSS